MAVLERLYLRPVILWVLYGLLLTAVGITSGFAILANDAFPLLFQAEQLTLSDPRTWYNGFFPIGYPLLLKALLLFGRASIDWIAVAFNILVSFGFFFFGKRLFDTTGLKTSWKLIGLLSIAFLPEVLRGVMTIRPDYLVMILSLASFVCIKEERYTWVGVLLGLSYLFRSHMLALVAGVLAGLLLLKGVRPALTVLLSTLPFVLLQGILNMTASESFLASSQGFNIAKLMYGADWKSEQQITDGAFEIIASDPMRFFAAWMNHLLVEWYFPLIFFIGLFFTESRKFSLIALIYCFIVAAGGSPRGTLPIQPIAVLTVFFLVSRWLNRLDDRRHLIPTAVTILLVTGASIILFKAANKSRTRIERYDEVARGLGLETGGDALRVLTDDFSLYFPNQANAEPRVNGGWGVIGVPVYRERVPQFTEQNPDLLRAKLYSNGVQHIVLSQPTLDPKLLNTISSDTVIFERKQDISGYAVYRVH